MKYFEKSCGLIQKIDKDELLAQVDYAKKKASVFLEFAMKKAHGFSVLDFAMLKICLISLGLWLGARFSGFFRRFKGVLFLGFILSYVFLIWRIFFLEDDV